MPPGRELNTGQTTGRMAGQVKACSRPKVTGLRAASACRFIFSGEPLHTMMRALHLASALLLVVAIHSAAAAESEAEETRRYTREAVERVVNSHDNVLIMKGGELMIRRYTLATRRKNWRGMLLQSPRLWSSSMGDFSRSRSVLLLLICCRARECVSLRANRESD